MFNKIKNLYKRLTNQAIIDGCAFSVSDNKKDIIIRTKGTIAITNRMTNRKKYMTNMLLGIVDAGHDIIEFELYDLKDPDWRVLVGHEDFSYETMSLYYKLLPQLDKKELLPSSFQEKFKKFEKEEKDGVIYLY